MVEAFTNSPSEAAGDIALLDSGTTHTILQDPSYFDFSSHAAEISLSHDADKAPRPDSGGWQTCELNTVAGKRTMRFREGRARVRLPGGATLTCENAMLAPEAKRT